MEKLKLSSIIFAAFFVLVLFLLWLMFKPFLGAIIFAAIIAGTCYPLFTWFKKKSKLSKNLSALIVCFLIVILLFIPIIYITFQLSRESINLYQDLKEGLNNKFVDNFLFGEGSFAILFKEVLTFLNIDHDVTTLKDHLFQYIHSFSGYLLKLINNQISNILSFFFDFFIMILVIFSLFVEGQSLKKFLLDLSPVPDDQEELIIKRFNQMNYVTLVCNGLGAAIQGVLAGIGFFIVGLNSIFLWSVIMVILAFIPLLGISIIYIPASIYLWLIGKSTWAIILFTYCSVIALIVENWFKPKFIGNRIKINTFFVFFCIIGGLAVFNMAGIFYGPLIGIIFLTMADIYHEYYAPSC